ncbi:MAG TPA: hypothetical protein VIU02_03025 [Burkholderiales bacterium]
MTIVGAFVFGIPSIVAVVMNYIYQSEVRGSFLESHFRWQIRTFWFALLWVGLGVLLVLTIVGILVAWAVFLAAGIWVIYRIARGWLTLQDHKPLQFSQPRAGGLREICLQLLQELPDAPGILSNVTSPHPGFGAHVDFCCPPFGNHANHNVILEAVEERGRDRLDPAFGRILIHDLQIHRLQRRFRSLENLVLFGRHREGFQVGIRFFLLRGNFGTVVFDRMVALLAQAFNRHEGRWILHIGGDVVDERQLGDRRLVGPGNVCGGRADEDAGHGGGDQPGRAWYQQEQAGQGDDCCARREPEGPTHDRESGTEVPEAEPVTDARKNHGKGAHQRDSEADPDQPA